MAYGKHLILDMYGCNPKNFNREKITNWLVKLCEMIDMEREDLYFWNYDGVPPEELPAEKHLLGTSAVQFITTSNIVIHTLELVGEAYIDIFSCKNFDQNKAAYFTTTFFEADTFDTYLRRRGVKSECKNIKFME